ncbi:MAG: hypothetical protein WA865_17705 [Spirulinaceae cyanobacterium]
MAKNFDTQDFQVMADIDCQHETEEMMATDITNIAIDNEMNISSNQEKTYTVKELCNELGKAERTVRGWIKTVKDTYSWLDESEISSKQGRTVYYTAFTLTQLEDIKTHLDGGDTLDSWVQTVSMVISPENQKDSTEDIVEPANGALATYNPSTLATTPKYVPAELVTYDLEPLEQPSLLDQLTELADTAQAEAEAEVEKTRQASENSKVVRTKLTQYVQAKQTAEVAKLDREKQQQEDAKLLSQLQQLMGK